MTDPTSEGLAPNRWTLVGTLIECEPLRHTPAGVPVARGKLRYQGEVSEAGKTRKLDFDVALAALGETAQALRDRSLGDRLVITGFVAPRSKRSRQWVLHIQTLTLEETTDHGCT